MARKIFAALLIFVFIYLGTGVAFHFKWKSDLEACREMREGQGEFVEPEVFSGVLGLLFNMTNWPVYGWANIYHFGTPFATPCSHSFDQEEEAAVRHVAESFEKRIHQLNDASGEADIEAGARRGKAGFSILRTPDSPLNPNGR